MLTASPYVSVAVAVRERSNAAVIRETGRAARIAELPAQIPAPSIA